MKLPPLCDWDDAFANMKHVEKSEELPGFWSARAAAYREELRAGGRRLDTDISYGSHPREKFDLVWPDGTPKGLAVFIHGGFWMRLDKNYWTHFAEGARAQGWAICLPSYTLTPEARIHEITAQIGSATSTAALFGAFKPQDIHPSGTSGAGKTEETTMSAMAPGIAKAREGLDEICWNILGQTYVPKQKTEECFTWHATLPPGTFVPPHIHPDQDEFLYILEGRFDFLLDGKETFAEPGDLVKLPRGIPHGIFNKSGSTIKTLFWVTPTAQLYDLFWALHNLGPDADPAEIVAVSAAHAIDFLPPEDEAEQ